MVASKRRRPLVMPVFITLSGLLCPQLCREPYVFQPGTESMCSEPCTWEGVIHVSPPGILRCKNFPWAEMLPSMPYRNCGPSLIGVNPDGFSERCCCSGVRHPKNRVLGDFGIAAAEQIR